MHRYVTYIPRTYGWEAVLEMNNYIIRNWNDHHNRLLGWKFKDEREYHPAITW